MAVFCYLRRILRLSTEGNSASFHSYQLYSYLYQYDIPILQQIK